MSMICTKDTWKIFIQFWCLLIYTRIIELYGAFELLCCIHIDKSLKINGNGKFSVMGLEIHWL